MITRFVPKKSRLVSLWALTFVRASVFQERTALVEERYPEKFLMVLAGRKETDRRDKMSIIRILFILFRILIIDDAINICGVGWKVNRSAEDAGKDAVFPAC